MSKQSMIPGLVQSLNGKIQISINEHVSGVLSLRPEVARFAQLMEAKLRVNDHKPPWKNDQVHWLFNRLTDECVELHEALTDGSPKIDVGYECADVANFAMMIADVKGALK